MHYQYFARRLDTLTKTFGSRKIKHVSPHHIARNAILFGSTRPRGWSCWLNFRLTRATETSIWAVSSIRYTCRGAHMEAECVEPTHACARPQPFLLGSAPLSSTHPCVRSSFYFPRCKDYSGTLRADERACSVLVRDRVFRFFTLFRQMCA